MARTRRPPTRVEQLAEALAAAQESEALLLAIDLRTCTRELRDTLKKGRLAARALCSSIEDTLALDEPAPPRAKVATSPG